MFMVGQSQIRRAFMNHKIWFGGQLDKLNV